MRKEIILQEKFVLTSRGAELKEHVAYAIAHTNEKVRTALLELTKGWKGASIHIPAHHALVAVMLRWSRDQRMQREMRVTRELLEGFVRDHMRTYFSPLTSILVTLPKFPGDTQTP